MKKINRFLVISSAVAVVVSGVAVLNFSESTNVYADSLCVSQRCREAEAAEAAAREQAIKAAEQKGTYQGEVNRLASEVAQIQAEINKNEEEILQLQIQIDAAEVKLNSLKTILSKTITKLYLESETTPLEVLASSQSVGDFTNRQAQQDSVKKKVKVIADDVKVTKATLETNRRDAEIRRTNNQARRDQVATMQAEQQAIVNLWSGRESEYNAQATENSRIKEEERSLRRAQNAAHGSGTISAGDPGRGGYPEYLYNACQDCLVDPWGMYNRECVSYAAWKVHQAYGNMPYWGGKGNAYQWIGNAHAAGIPVSSTPKAGVVGIATWGAYGHAIWVESVNSNGTINLSEFNWRVDGRYTERYNVNPSEYTYLYFGG